MPTVSLSFVNKSIFQMCMLFPIDIKVPNLQICEFPCVHTILTNILRILLGCHWLWFMVIATLLSYYLTICTQEKITYLTLSAHVREGYSSQFVCVSVCQHLISKTAVFSRLKRALT